MKVYNKQKINWLLILQGWAMLWVVIGHSSLGIAGEGPDWENLLFHIAYSFHMPLFMLVSGYLFHYTRLSELERLGSVDFKCYKSMMWNKAKRLLIPYVVFTFVAFSLKLAFPDEMSRRVAINLKEILHIFLYPNDNPLRELWFIAALMWLFAMMPVWAFVIKRQLTQWGAVFVLLFLHFHCPDTEFLCIGRAFSYAIWFYLGIILSKEMVVAKLEGKYRLLTLLLGIAIYAIGFVTDPILTTMGGIIVSISVALILDRYSPSVFSSFRNYTYQIFLMGIFVQILVKIIFKHLGGPYIIAYIACILLGVYVPVLISKLISRQPFGFLKLCIGIK